jgi:hypothetical protein
MVIGDTGSSNPNSEEVVLRRDESRGAPINRRNPTRPTEKWKPLLILPRTTGYWTINDEDQNTNPVTLGQRWLAQQQGWTAVAIGPFQPADRFESMPQTAICPCASPYQWIDQDVALRVWRHRDVVSEE